MGYFGGTVSEKGYKMLDSHIGLIYGDAITYDRAKEICEKLDKKDLHQQMLFMVLDHIPINTILGTHLVLH